jgi:hypothetical protein
MIDKVVLGLGVFRVLTVFICQYNSASVPTHITCIHIWLYVTLAIEQIKHAEKPLRTTLN